MPIMIDGVALRLMQSFPGSFINHHGEFIAHRKANAYFNLSTCADELQVKCKVLEWLSRSACKSMPFESDNANRKLWKFMRDGINAFLHTEFSAPAMMDIYTYLGNGINRAKTIRFIESGFDMSVLTDDKNDTEV